MDLKIERVKKQKAFCERLKKWQTKAKRLADYELLTEKKNPRRHKKSHLKNGNWFL